MARKIVEKLAAPERKGALARGVLAYRDILDQPKGAFYVMVDTSSAQSILLAADKVDVSEEAVVLYLKNDEDVEGHTGWTTVASFNSRLPWYAVAKDYVDVMTLEQMTRVSTEDHKAMHELEKSLVAARGCPEGDVEKHGLPGAPLDQPVGQYL